MPEPLDVPLPDAKPPLVVPLLPPLSPPDPPPLLPLLAEPPLPLFAKGDPLLDPLAHAATRPAEMARRIP
jgi:hypothetical protein